MDFGAAAGESATSGWFEGWVGGLIAAAVTLTFTVSWEARRERRDRLENALAELSAAADAFWATEIDPAMTVGDSLTAYLRLAKAVPMAQWELVRIPARWRWVPRRVYRSRRLGLAYELGATWSRLSSAKSQAEPGTQGKIALEISVLGLRWLKRPKTFPRGTFAPE